MIRFLVMDVGCPIDAVCKVRDTAVFVSSHKGGDGAVREFIEYLILNLIVKHVFVIGSHTPYLTAIGVINKLELKHEDVVFVLGRHYKCFDQPKDIKVCDMSHLYFRLLRNLTPWNCKAYVKKIDDFIEENVGEDYILYMCHLLSYPNQSMATNPLCKEVKFIQEGIIDMCVGNPKHRITLKGIIGNTFYMNFGRTWKTDYWDDYRCGVRHASETFAITPSLFNKLDCKHTLVDWPKMNIPLTLADDGIYFVFESLVEQRNIEKHIFMEATEKMIRKYAGKHNYVKYHPFQKQENKDYITSLFSKCGTTVEMLPDNVPFEMILATQPHMKVCGFTTSLIFFSALLPQHEAHICVPALYPSKKFVKGYWNNFKSHLDRCYGEGRFNFETL